MYAYGMSAYVEVVQNASGPLLVEIDKLPGNPLGITLTQGRYRSRRVLYIDSVAAASIADRSVKCNSAADAAQCAIQSTLIKQMIYYCFSCLHRSCT